MAEDFPAEIPDERFTPLSTMRELQRVFRFDVDAFSHPRAPSAAVIGRYWTAVDDAYRQRWDGLRVFVQPPYSAIEPALAAQIERARTVGAFSVALLPAWTDREWWERLVEPNRDRGLVLRGRGLGVRGFHMTTRFLPGRMRFGNPYRPDPENDGGPKVDQAKFGMVLIQVRPA